MGRQKSMVDAIALPGWGDNTGATDAISFATVDGGAPGKFNPGILARPAAPTPAAPTVTDTYGTAGGPITPGVGPGPGHIAPPEVLPPTYHGPVPTGYDPSPGITPPPVTGAGNMPTAPHYQTPNFDAFPGVVRAKGAEQLGLSQAATNFQSFLNDLLIKYGDASLASQVGLGVDPQAAAFARANYLSGNSDLARIDQQNEKQKRAIVNHLASHGILFSGDLGYQNQQLAQATGQSKYDLTQSLLSQLKKAQQDKLAYEQQLHSNVDDAYTQAYNFYLQNPDLFASGS